MSVFARNLGRISYCECLKIQKELVHVYKKKEEDAVSGEMADTSGYDYKLCIFRWAWSCYVNMTRPFIHWD